METPDAKCINGAASQFDRWLRALDPDFAKVDERSFTELLDFAAKFGRLINFYDLDNKKDRDWEPFFLSDSTMMLASLKAIDVSQLEAEFIDLERQALETHSFESKFESLRKIFAFILSLARQIDLQLKTLALYSDDATLRLLRQAIETEIKNTLGDQLRLLKAYDLGAGLDRALGTRIGLDYEGFSTVWALNYAGADDSIYKGRTNSRKINRALSHLTPLFSAFLYAISDLQQFAESNLPATLERSNHAPQLALFIAFARLFQTAQDSINTFSSRYARFYYRDVLRERYLHAIPDSVYLIFTLDESVDVTSTTIPRGTLFPAGKGKDNLDLLYASDHELVVSGAIIKTLQTVRVIQEKLVPKAADPSTQVPQRVLSAQILANGSSNSWATFGPSQAGKNETEVTALATLGFAVASSYLWLSGGKRTVTLTLRYSPESWTSFLEMLSKLSAATSLPVATIFQRILCQAFTLFVSMSAGWFRVDHYKVLPVALSSGADPLIVLQFELPANVPPVVAYDPAGDAVDDGSAKVVAAPAEYPAVYASNPEPSQPTLKAYLRQEEVFLNGIEVYPLSLVATLDLTSFQIETNVSSLSGLQLANTDGEIDPSAPFPLFGGVPVAGSYLLIRHEELFAKTVNNLKIYVTWFNLPANKNGFQGYYRDYVIGPDGNVQRDLFNNLVFQGGLSIQNPGRWFLNGSAICPDVPVESVGVFLFRTGHDGIDNPPLPAGALSPLTAFDTVTVCPSTPPNYYDPAASAIKLELTGPSYAFGNDLYAPNVLNGVVESLPDADACREECLAEYQVLLAASQCIDACLKCLAGCSKTPQENTQCVVACVSTCLQCLLDQAIQSLTQCLDEPTGAAVEDVMHVIVGKLKRLHEIATVEQGQFISSSLKLLTEWLELSGEGNTAGVNACLEKCRTVLQAILCVLVAVAECSEDWENYGQCLIDSLTNCKQQLDEAYAKDLENCMTDCLSIKKPLRYPNDPYLPQAVSVSVNYSASCTSASAAGGRFFHLLPFGGYDVLTPTQEKPKSLLPRFAAGNLYLGFSGLVLPQTLTLLFQMAVSSVEPKTATPPEVVWEYLGSNQWQRLSSSAIVSDSTNGLQNSGILALNLPAYDAANNTVLPGDLQWLRASVAEFPEQFPATIGIYPYAVRATWRDDDNNGEHLAKPLPPGTINSSVDAPAGAGTINQPMPSFGGRPPETESRAFDIRVGERLRHKDRAILGWDYERLVLERFPTVWKTQTLAARDPKGDDAPGNVVVVIVPGPDSTGVVDPTTPAATGEMLSQIQSYLEGLSSPFIQLHVVNPRYVRIEVAAIVQFTPGNDTGACIKRLNNELVRYLSPWFFDAARAARGGRYISPADISEFIQTRPYVDALVAIKQLEYDPPPENLDWYFLTSAQQHKIQIATG